MGYNDNNIVIEGARIIFRNFAGRQTQFNEAGKRNFSVVLDPGIAEKLKAEGWNVKQKEARDEGDLPLFHLPVTLRFDGKTPPRLILISSRGRNTLNEELAEMIDYADFDTIDLIIRPYDWKMRGTGNTGRKAMLHSFYGKLTEDVLQRKYADYAEIGGRPDVHLPDDADEYDLNDD